MERFMRALPLLSAVFLLAFSWASQAQMIKGTSALQGDAPQADGYLKATSGAGNPLEQKLDIWMTLPHSTAAIKSYQVEMTKKIHVVVVSDDFKTFMHIHPTLSPTGHFLITQTFPAPGIYQVYADGLPNNMNHQVFRFEMPVGQATNKGARTLPANGMGVHVGPYEVDLSTVRMHAGRMEMVDVEILENGQPAKDLHPYLGAPAHAVFLNSKDLSYVHVHPMAMDASMDMSKPMPDMPDNASSPSEMMLMVSIKEAGTYKLWLQFRGANDQLYVAQFTVLASA
jgi:hypothetical protein